MIQRDRGEYDVHHKLQHHHYHDDQSRRRRRSQRIAPADSIIIVEFSTAQELVALGL
jgi:hypothetical protein